MPSAAAAAPLDFGGTIRNVLPPGQSGELPPENDSVDQIPLYDGLTPLGRDLRPGAATRYFKSARFDRPRGGRVVRPRKGLTIRRDRYGVPHVHGKTRSKVMFGAGWATAEDRGLFIETIRGPARIAALDAPGLDPFSLGISLRRFEPSAATERFLRRQARSLLRAGRKGRRVVRDVDAYVAGINAYYRRSGNTAEPWRREDVVAVAALIGAIFGKGGGDEVRSSQLLSALRERLGARAGTRVWRDLRSAQDPETPVTLRKRFPYDTGGRGGAPGSRTVDPDSVSASAARAARVDQRQRVPMSNALLVGARRSATGRPLAVMGPQVGYFYPQFLMELDLHGGGIDARGAAFPGISMYVLLGRGRDYAWSATSSGADNVDQYVERLCNADGSPPTRGSTGYVFRGRCRQMRTFDAGTLSGGGSSERVRFRQTVHGPVSGTVEIGGRPFAVTSKRSTRGRDAISAIAFADLNANRVRSARSFLRVMGQVELTFNWHYADNRDVAFFSSGRLPIRARGVDPSLPTLGTGRYEWRGYLPRSRHPQAINPRRGILANWNNKPAAGFGASDSQYGYGSVQRVELFDGFGTRMRLHDLIAVMNAAATRDLRATDTWPAIAAVLRRGPAPGARAAQAADLVTEWVQAGAHRLDRDLDGAIDNPGAAVLDRAWPALADAVLAPVLGPLTADLARIVRRDDAANSRGSSYGSGWYGYVDKDLRTQLGRRVRGRYSRRYCGGGDLARCRESLWTAVEQAADELAATQGADPAAWRADATGERIVFQPGLLGPDRTMRWTNRPTFQQVVSFKGHRPRGRRRGQRLTLPGVRPPFPEGRG
ncbi:MAG: penicillin acylase family protein [Thermoleophilaceae bacterium]